MAYQLSYLAQYHKQLSIIFIYIYIFFKQPFLNLILFIIFQVIHITPKNSDHTHNYKNITHLFTFIYYFHLYIHSYILHIHTYTTHPHTHTYNTHSHIQYSNYYIGTQSLSFIHKHPTYFF